MFVSPRFLKPHVSRVLLGCLLFFMLGASGANAAEGGKEVTALYVKVAPFTVNLHDRTRFLQVGMTLKAASPLLAKVLKENMPIILNELTYLLSDREASQFGSSAGKQVLIQQARSVINRALSLTINDGVTEVFLETLVIQ